eukprot:557227-Rhodomonas_salina.1
MFGGVLGLHGPLHLSKENAQLRKTAAQKHNELMDATSALYEAGQHHRETVAGIEHELAQTRAQCADMQHAARALEKQAKTTHGTEKCLRAEIEGMSKQHAKECTRLRKHAAGAAESAILAEAGNEAAREELAAVRGAHKAHQRQYENLIREFTNMQQKYNVCDERLHASLGALVATKRDLVHAQKRLANYAEVEKLLEDTATLIIKAQTPKID